MSRFEAIDLSQAVAQCGKVKRQRSLFGTHTVYLPTSSRIDSYRNYFGEQEGSSLLQLAKAQTEETTSILEQLNELKTDDKGTIRMDLCISRDHQFIAFQLFRQSAEAYTPISKVTYLEGHSAELLEDKLV